ncbi:MAG: hypothetical protein RL367_1933 [Pseudomonadota bacterium]
MSTDLAKLKTQLLASMMRGPLADRISDIDIEADVDRDGSEFLRIVVKLRFVDKDYLEMGALLESVESEVFDMGGPYPSVRFQDAA